jgi:hypothetical protein
MTKQVQLRRGTTSQHAVFTGALAEVTVDTDLKVAVVHDGSTVGGNYLVGVGAAQTITNKLAVGIGTTNAQKQLHVIGESLLVGDARITGILSVGQSTITLNGPENTVNIGAGITISGNTGILSATTVSAAQVVTPTLVVNKLDITGYGVTTFSLDTTTTGTVSSGSTIIPLLTVLAVEVGDTISIGTYLSNVTITGVGTTTID